MNEEDETKRNRSVPISDLDFNSMLSNPLWGQDWENPDIKQKLTNVRIKLDEHGIPLYHEEIKKDGKNTIVTRFLLVEETSEYESLSFITRDFRLGNLSRINGEYERTKHFGQLAHDLLQLGFKKSHTACLCICAMELELSQSRAGFFRKIMNTFFQESKVMELEPSKKSLFGGKKKEKEY